ncbi:hypothetical protein K7432_016150, partial [Basidiobolus ranarum]
MTVASNKVKFAYELSMQGSEFETYEKGQTVRFNYGDPYNDKFRSVVVGASVRLNIWEHNEFDTPVPGKYDELAAGTYDNLDYLNGVSKFQVIGAEFQYGIDVKLVDQLN